MNVDGEVYEVGALIWLDNGTTLRAFPMGMDRSYVIIKGEGEETNVNATIEPMHDICNVDYKKKELKKQLYLQQNINADIVKENFDLSNEVQSLKRYINSIENQTEIAEHAIVYWEEKYDKMQDTYYSYKDGHYARSVVGFALLVLSVLTNIILTRW